MSEQREKLVNIVLLKDKETIKGIYEKDTQLRGILELQGDGDFKNYTFTTEEGIPLFSLSNDEFSIVEYITTRLEILKDLIQSGHFIKNISIRKPVYADYKAEMDIELKGFYGTVDQYKEFEKYKEKEITLRYQRDVKNFYEESLKSGELKKKIEECFDISDHPKKDLFWSLMVDLSLLNSSTSSFEQLRILQRYEEYVELIK